MAKQERSVVFLRVPPNIKAALVEQSAIEKTSIQSYVLGIVLDHLDENTDVTPDEADRNEDTE
jgi:hypothetical protein